MKQIRNNYSTEIDEDHETITALRFMEKSYRLEESSAFHMQALLPHISAKDMHHIIDWKYKVVDALDLDREIVEFSVNFLHRHLSRCFELRPQEQIGVPEFRLASLTCLHIALKAHGKQHISARVYGKLGNDFTKRDIAQYEMTILRSLRFKLNPPTASVYMKEIFRLSNIEDEKVSDYALYLIQLAMYDYSSMWYCYSPFSLAYTALQQALTLCRTRRKVCFEQLATFGVTSSVFKSHQSENEWIKEVQECSNIFSMKYNMVCIEHTLNTHESIPEHSGNQSPRSVSSKKVA